MYWSLLPEIGQIPAPAQPGLLGGQQSARFIPLSACGPTLLLCGCSRGFSRGRMKLSDRELELDPPVNCVLLVSETRAKDLWAAFGERYGSDG